MYQYLTCALKWSIFLSSVLHPAKKISPIARRPSAKLSVSSGLIKFRCRLVDGLSKGTRHSGFGNSKDGIREERDDDGGRGLTSAGLTGLPYDVLVVVYEFLDIRDIAHLSMVGFFELVMEPKIWPYMNLCIFSLTQSHAPGLLGVAFYQYWTDDMGCLFRKLDTTNNCTRLWRDHRSNHTKDYRALFPGILQARTCNCSRRTSPPWMGSRFTTK